MVFSISWHRVIITEYKLSLEEACMLNTYSQLAMLCAADWIMSYRHYLPRSVLTRDGYLLRETLGNGVWLVEVSHCKPATEGEALSLTPSSRP